MRAAGLKEKPSKCHMLQKMVHYLGYIISEGGVATDPNMLLNGHSNGGKRATKFLGLASYYRKFLHKLQHTCISMERSTAG